MAEQSSTVAAFRALVMLVCLILIPVAAFCGGSFPAVVKAIQSGRWPTLADFRGPPGPAPNQSTEAPRFRSPAISPAQPTAPLPGSVLAGSFPDSQGGTTRSPVVAVNYNAPIASPPRMETGPLTGFPQQGKDTTRQLAPLPSGPGNPFPSDHAATTGQSDAPAFAGRPGGSTPPTDQFKYVHERLRQLGATYLILETYGDEIRQFRFYCRMSVGGNPRVTRPFWCLDSDPLQAMTRVLKQVEEWQTGGG